MLADGGEPVLSPPSPCRFLLKIFQISGRKNCNETILVPENGIFHRFQSSRARRTRRRARIKLERAPAISSSPRVFRQSESRAMRPALSLSKRVLICWRMGGSQFFRRHSPCRFLLKISQISWRKNCSETILVPENGIFHRFQSSRARRTRRRARLKLESGSAFSMAPKVFSTVWSRAMRPALLSVLKIKIKKDIANNWNITYTIINGRSL